RIAHVAEPDDCRVDTAFEPRTDRLPAAHARGHGQGRVDGDHRLVAPAVQIIEQRAVVKWRRATVFADFGGDLLDLRPARFGQGETCHGGVLAFATAEVDAQEGTKRSLHPNANQ